MLAALDLGEDSPPPRPAAAATITAPPADADDDADDDDDLDLSELDGLENDDAEAAEEEVVALKIAMAPPPADKKQAAPMPVVIGGSRTYKLPSIKTGVDAEKADVMTLTTAEQVLFHIYIYTMWSFPGSARLICDSLLRIRHATLGLDAYGRNSSAQCVGL